MSSPTKLVPWTPAITNKPDKEFNAKELTAPNLGPSEAEPSHPSQSPPPKSSPRSTLSFDCAANVPHPSFGNSSDRNSHASSSTAAVSPMDVAPTALASAPEEFAQTSQESQGLEAKAWY
ncbi:hypothetical protein NA56DRAFT_695865 [Hyaloscypha hepaticicola]|uniref:Uncharacterized protein n=1 Tax=Hyaloscypha hepaticicola TaxID=2082293 RepID=A0A2J6QPE1_9HELO|nr:hypothetical protein NA56DRAFT_695865 [Hyaloscypha hepaticicola]